MNILLPMMFIFIIFAGRYTYLLNSTNVHKRSVNKRGRKVAYFLLIFIAATRYNVGYDYMTYLNIFHSVERLFSTSNFGFFATLTYIIGIYFQSPQLIFIVYSVATLYFICSTIEHEADDCYEGLIIYTSMFYLESFSTIRQSLAVAMMFWSFKYIKDKHFIKYCVMSILVSLVVHTSAILALPIYIIYHRFKLIPIIITVIFLIFWGKPLIDTLINLDLFSNYQRYYNLEGQNMQGYGKIMFFYIFLVLFCTFFSLFCHKNKSREIQKLVSIVLIGTSFPALFGPHIGMRSSEYFSIYFILLIPKLYNNIWKNIPSRMIGLIPFYAYYVLFLLIDSLNTSGYTPFQFVFLK